MFIIFNVLLVVFLGFYLVSSLTGSKKLLSTTKVHSHIWSSFESRVKQDQVSIVFALYVN